MGYHVSITEKNIGIKISFTNSSLHSDDLRGLPREADPPPPPDQCPFSEDLRIRVMV